MSASIHWKLFNDLWLATRTFAREMNESRAFWSLTIAAHRDVVLFRLGRLYDQSKQALSLRTWLGTIEANAHLFDREGFRERLKDNPFVDSLSASARKPHPVTLKNDVATVSSQSDELVQRLCDLRNKVLAHRDPLLVVEPQWANTGELSNTDIETLLDRAVTVVNRYNSLFRARSYSTNIVGRDDYESMLRLVRRGIDAHEAEIEAQIAEAQRNASNSGTG